MEDVCELQNGHARPLFPMAILASHSCPLLQRHQTFFREERMYSQKDCAPRSLSDAIPYINLGCGLGGYYRVAQTFQSNRGTHDLSFYLQSMTCHSCPFSHCHQTFLFEPHVTPLGVKVPFFVGCH